MTPPNPSPPARDLLILAVDDKPANLIALERALAGIPARMVKATSGEEALAACLRHQFALAILDVQMPGMDGYELAEILLNDPATARTPIIFVTAAHSDEQHLFKGYSAGAVDYLVKPYDPTILLAKVQVFLELASHRLGLEGMVAERTQALQASERRYRLLFETMDQGILYHDPDGCILEANPAAGRILGARPEALVGRSLSDPGFGLMTEDGAPLPPEAHPVVLAVRTGRATPRTTVGARRADDDAVVWLNLTATPQFNEAGETAWVSTAFTDETARLDAERRVAASEQLLRAVFDQTADGLLVADPTRQTVRLANQAMSTLIGHEGTLDVGVLVPAALAGLVTTSDAPRTQLDVPLTRGDGEEVVVDARVATVALPGGASVLAVFRDMTDRRHAEHERQRLQAELFQAQRMESIGALASGVAHDFNNLLSVILGYVGLALESEDTSETMREDLAEVKRAGEQSADLTRQLLAFARKQVIQRTPTDFNKVAVGLEKMLRRIIGEHIQLELALDPDLGIVNADPGQIEQIVMNLAINARDAMPSGGKITLTTRNIEVSPRQSEVAPGRYVRLSMTDTGQGMDAATRARIFEPFFTTKARDKGTGLGLSTVYGIVKQSDGYVLCTSRVGHGTTFDIYLPRVEGVTNVKLAPASPGPQIRGGGETVLVVEDADPVRSLTARALNAVGYRVLTAMDGVDALRTSEAWAAPIDLVLTDVVMPRMGGEELVKRLRETRPTSRVLFMSGYLGAMADQADSPITPANLIDKPFRIDDLVRRIRAALDTAPPG